MTIRSVMSRQHHNPTQMRRRDGCPIGHGWMIRNDDGHGRIAVVLLCLDIRNRMQQASAEVARCYGLVGAGRLKAFD